MEQNSEQNVPKIEIPPALFALDIVGVLLLALGAYLHFGDSKLIPESLRFAHDDLVFMVIGFMLTQPLLFHFIKVGKARNKAQNPSKSEPTVR